MDKIDIVPIIVRHLDTLRDYSSHQRKLSDLAVFFGLPLVASGVALYLGWSLSVEALNALLASFAIFAGLLLNLLILVYTFSTDANNPSALSKVRAIVTRELHDNIAYSVLVSVMIVVIALIAIAVAKKGDPGGGHTGRYISSALIYLTANFVLTLLMILKRIHTMLGEKLKQVSIRRAS